MDNLSKMQSVLERGDEVFGYGNLSGALSIVFKDKEGKSDRINYNLDQILNVAALLATYGHTKLIESIRVIVKKRSDGSEYIEVMPKLDIL
ncbi:MAG TPA: hypothetical protein PKJ47_10595 [Candidatus Limiplasma sp.]|nr:hypothetical protein [Candidatus Limiplasma sp.]